jgi:hypothetical protein
MVPARALQMLPVSAATPGARCGVGRVQINLQGFGCYPPPPRCLTGPAPCVHHGLGTLS